MARAKHVRTFGRQRHADDQQAIDVRYLIDIFSAPQWLKNLGALAWLLVGITVMAAAAAGLLAITSVIVVPVVTAMMIAVVCSPLMSSLGRRGVPRGLGAALVFLAITGLAAAMGYLVLRGVASQTSQISASLKSAVASLESDLKNLGIGDSAAKNASDGMSSGASDAFHKLVTGLSTGVEALASLVIFISFTALSLFFLLKDGPPIRRWVERHVGLAPPVARVVTSRSISSLRGYFAGATIVAAFNGIVIGLGAWALGVPLAASIGIVNFGASYIPYIGAWSAGAFTVAIAYGSGGADVAAAMVVLVLLANGILQQLVQPIAMGTALGIHPLAVLIVTIVGGSIFGTIGLILAAPVVSAAVRIAADLTRGRAKAAREAQTAPGSAGGGAPGGPQVLPG